MVGGFATFYAAFPRKRAKIDAQKAWKQVHGDEKFGAIMALLAERAEEWKRRPITYTPYPASFLRGEDFDDEFEARADDREPDLFAATWHHCEGCTPAHDWEDRSQFPINRRQLLCESALKLINGQ